MELPFTLEIDLERVIAADPLWQKGVVWGEPRTGHLEGPVMYHIADVLANIDCQIPSPDSEERHALRFIALVHDTFKYQVDERRPKIGSNHHAHIARNFAASYIHDTVILDIIEMHDDAYHCWRLGFYKGKWQHAEERANMIVQRLGAAFPLYMRFFFADSATESKDPAPMNWFGDFCRQRGYTVPLYEPRLCSEREDQG
ncbi:MAG TPA: hypothetical protein VL461_10615 [Dictyobacter sp.]|nr:hypothetical protein [Dictyobacter sp.]